MDEVAVKTVTANAIMITKELIALPSDVQKDAVDEEGVWETTHANVILVGVVRLVTFKLVLETVQTLEFAGMEGAFALKEGQVLIVLFLLVQTLATATELAICRTVTVNLDGLARIVLKEFAQTNVLDMVLARRVSRVLVILVGQGRIAARKLV